jgi:hypothetical protein
MQTPAFFADTPFFLPFRKPASLLGIWTGASISGFAFGLNDQASGVFARDAGIGRLASWMLYPTCFALCDSAALFI